MLSRSTTFFDFEIHTTTMSAPSPSKMTKLSQDSQGDGLIEKSLLEIDVTQKELDALNAKAYSEIFLVENKFNKLKKPFYDRRATIIERIPNFWVNSLINHPQISMIIDETDEDCIHFLRKLEVEQFESSETGFRIKFGFDENPFFENKELIKELKLEPGTEPESTSTVIQWKENMDLSKKHKEKVLQQGKRGLDAKTFFSWFSDDTDPCSDEISEIIMEDLWINPLQYFLNAEEGSDDSDDEDSEEEEDEEDEEEEEEEEADQGADDSDEGHLNDDGEDEQ